MLADEIGPRLSGSKGAAVAVERVAAELKALGLDVRLEPVKVPHWVRGTETASLTRWPNHVEGLNHQLAVTALGGSVATPKNGLTAEVLPVRDYAALEALGRSCVQGRIVLFTATFDEAMADAGRAGDAYSRAVDYRVNGAGKAAALGAVAALNRSAGRTGNHQPHTGSVRYADGVPKIPAGALAVEDAMLIERLAAKGPVTMQLTLTPRILPDADSFNVVADLKGREKPDEIVLVSGHLDSWDLGPSAQDDATGVAAAMQVAATLKALGLTPRRTIRIVAWMNEENGLAGDPIVYWGGPVSPERGFVIHDGPDEWDSTMNIGGGLYITTSKDILKAIGEGKGPGHYFVALGYASWGEGQLENEIMQNSWLNAEVDRRILFKSPPSDRWKLATRLLGVDVTQLGGDAGHA